MTAAWRRAVALAAGAGLLLVGCAPSATPSPPPAAEAPRVLTDEQSELLAAMRFRNFASGIVAFEAGVLSDSGDLTLRGWLDFEHRSGYARVVPVGAEASSFLASWDVTDVAFLDTPHDLDPPALPAPAGAWQSAPLQAEASDLSRFMMALLLLSQDRPENPLLVRQNGARFLGEEEIAGTLTQHFSGVAADASAGDAADLSTQFWLDETGLLVRFGIRLSGADLSRATFDRSADVPQELPVPGTITGSSHGG